MWLFFRWEDRLMQRGQEPLVDPTLLKNRELSGGLTMFFFQYLIQMGVFFIVPLYLSVALGLSALATGVRILPLSLTLLLAAVGIPRLFPKASPRAVVRIGLLAMIVGAVVLMVTLDISSGAEVTTVPLLLVGLGMGALASQLGAVVVSAVPQERSAEIGGVQNTVTNLGASIGTALAGSVMIAVLTSSFLTNVQESPAIPADVKNQATTQLSGGVPFVSDAQLQSALDEAGADTELAQAALDANSDAQIDGLKAALAILVLTGLIGLIFVRRLPTAQPGSSRDSA